MKSRMNGPKRKRKTAKKEPEFTDEDMKSIREEIHSLHDFHALAKSIQKNSKGEVLADSP